LGITILHGGKEVNKRQSVLHGLKPAIMGLLLMALVYAGAAGARAFGAGNKIEFLAIAGLGVAWLVALAGTFLLRKTRPEFEYAFFTSIVSIVALITQGGMGAKNYLNNMQEQSFIQIDVMLFGYIALLGMVVLYRLLMKGIAGLIADKHEGKAGLDWKPSWIIGLVLIFAGTLFLPVATMFAGTVKLILSAAVILLMIIVEIYLCMYITRSGKKFQKKR
jgi:hypothetical protein